MTFGTYGRKVGMTQKFMENGDLIPVTVLSCTPCQIVQMKTKKKEGYNAYQLGFDENKKAQRVGKALKGHFQKAGTSLYKVVGEFRQNEVDDLKVGDTLSCDIFKVGDLVSVRSKTKGKGFQGVIKRHGFSRGPETHGSHHHRAPGSIGMCQDPGKVIKGTKLPGQMGSTFITLKNLEIMDVDLENGRLYIKGSVPGARNSVVRIVNNAAKLVDRLPKKEEPKVEEPKVEEKVETAPAEKKEEVKAEV